LVCILCRISYLVFHNPYRENFCRISSNSPALASDSGTAMPCSFCQISKLCTQFVGAPVGILVTVLILWVLWLVGVAGIR